VERRFDSATPIGLTLHCLGGLEATEGILTGVGNVQESVLILVLLVDAAHERGSGWKDLVDENEDSLLGRELDALADHVDELSNCEIGWYEVLLLVDSGDIALFDLLADDRNSVGILLADALGLSLALLEGMLVLELGSHFPSVG